MSQRMCIGGCGTEVSGRRRRCAECRRKLQRLLDKRHYHSARGQDADDYDHVDGELVVDYSNGGFEAPGLAAPVTQRQVARHDHVTRMRLEREAQADHDTDNEVTDWDAMVAQPRNSGRHADFHAATGTPPAPDPWGRSVRRSRGFRGREAPMELVNPAAEGRALGPDPAIAQAALHEHVSARFGGRVSPPGRQ
jgi:hypothetical protein